MKMYLSRDNAITAPNRGIAIPNGHLTRAGAGTILFTLSAGRTCHAP
jgi:hypothetical protein